MNQWCQWNDYIDFDYIHFSCQLGFEASEKGEWLCINGNLLSLSDHCAKDENRLILDGTGVNTITFYMSNININNVVFLATIGFLNPK